MQQVMENSLQIGCSLRRIHHFVSGLDTVRAEILQKSLLFGPILHIPDVPICCSLLECLIERYDYVNKCFIVNGHELFFKEEEMTMLLGLKIHDTLPSLAKKVCVVDTICGRYFPNQGVISRMDIHGALLTEELNENLEDFSKMASIFLLCEFLIPNRSGTIDKTYVEIVDSDDLPWGKIVYDQLLQSVQTCAIHSKKLGNHSFLGGCAYALQVWAFEHIPILSPSCDNSLTPRYRRHSKVKCYTREFYLKVLRKAKVVEVLKLSDEEISSMNLKSNEVGAPNISDPNLLKSVMETLKKIDDRLLTVENVLIKNKNKGERSKEHPKTPNLKEKVGSSKSVFNRASLNATEDVVRVNKPKVKPPQYMKFVKTKERRNIKLENAYRKQKKVEDIVVDVKGKKSVEDGVTYDGSFVEDEPSSNPCRKNEHYYDFRRTRYFSGSSVHPMETFHKPLAQLTDEDENMCTLFWSLKDSTDLLPVTGLEVCNLSRLQGTEWLDSDIISAYCCLLKNRESQHPEHYKRCHYFSPLFMAYLRRDHQLIFRDQGRDIPRNFMSLVRPRVGNYRISGCNKIFFPLHARDHWALLIIHVDRKIVELCDSLGSPTWNQWETDYKLLNGTSVEAVIMRYDTRMGMYDGKPRPGGPRSTLCVSSQVGCKMGCKFCATGSMGFKSNLSSGEIVEQLVHAYRFSNIRNVVFMGMGEPLNNYAALVETVQVMIGSPFQISPKRITISTVGIVHAINKLHDDLPNVNLAVSLHAPDQDIRCQIMPAARAFPLGRLIDALQAYHKNSQQKIFIEYIMLDGVNDQERHAHQLGKLLEVLQVVVNLIPFNPIGSLSSFRASTEVNIKTFQKVLRGVYNIRTTVRKQMGQDISGACGQLVLNQSEQISAGSASLLTDIEDLRI